MNLHFFRDAVRAKEIVTILLRYRFDEFLEKTDTPASWLTKFVPAVKENFSLWKRVRLAIEELGPTFIKIGQVLSTRPDILPRELIEELENLRDKVSARPFSEIRPVLERELRAPLEEFFDDFNETPHASGSLAQIYRAKLKSTGEPLAIKVQRPGIRKPIQVDLEIIAWLAEQMHENLAQFRPFDLPTVVSELRQGIMRELDFSLEARNANVFNSLNQFPDRVFAPKVFEEFTTPRLLVTDWIEGTTPQKSHVETGKSREIAEHGGHSFFSQIAITGFFHGDPHPGNLIISTDNRICFLDWGLAGQLTQRMRYALIDLFTACAKRDAALVAKIAMRLGRNTRRVSRIDLEKAITTVLFKYDADLKRMENIGGVIFELIFVFGSNGIHVARDYTLLAKAVISIERTAHYLDPSFNLIKIGQPYIRQLNWERWNPAAFSRNMITTWQEKISKIAELPEDIQRVIHRIEDEDLTLKIQHRGFDRASNVIHHAFSRLSLAVIIGSLIVGSSLVINTGIQPLLWGYPAIGIIGYLLSAAIGAYVAFDILRSGHKNKK